MNGESLRAICEDDDTPVQSTVYKWLLQRPEFAEKYARARDAQADTYADEIITISDRCRIGIKTERKETEAGDEVKTIEGDMVDRSRLQIDARKWFAARVAPKKYGDRTTLAGDKESPLELNVTTSHKDLLRARIAGIAARSGTTGSSGEPERS